MEEADRVRYLLPILTSFVRQGRIDSALKAVQGVDSESTKDDALKYLAVLVDGAKLYTEALATYDLQLTVRFLLPCPGTHDCTRYSSLSLSE